MVDYSPINELFSNLAALATLEYQERYVIGGNEEEYVAIDDLIYDYLESVDWMNNQILSESDRYVLNELAKFLDENCKEALAATNFAAVQPLMRNSQIWLDIRQRASDAIKQLGLKLDNVAVQDLDQHTWEYDVQKRMGLKDTNA